MNKYKLQVKVANGLIVSTFVWAESDYAARLLGESQYGKGNILSCQKV